MSASRGNRRDQWVMRRALMYTCSEKVAGTVLIVARQPLVSHEEEIRAEEKHVLDLRA